MKDIINNYTRQVTNFIKHLVGYKPTQPFRLIKITSMITLKNSLIKNIYSDKRGGYTILVT